MSAHRQHTFDVPPAPTPIPQIVVRMPDERLAFAAYFVMAACVVGAAIALTIGGRPPTATAVPTPRTVTTQLPPAADAAHQRLTIERLRDWRAGYEAAVENGCKVQPVLSSPVGRKP
jgi:hypothetical protein